MRQTHAFALHLCSSQVEVGACPRRVVALAKHEPLAPDVTLRPLQQVCQQLRCQVCWQGIAYHLQGVMFACPKCCMVNCTQRIIGRNPAQDAKLGITTCKMKIKLVSVLLVTLQRKQL